MGDTLKMKECDTMRILVVEDDRLLNNTLCYNLNTAGYAVDSALTKSAAGSFLTEQDYDLIVLDVNLPDGNGFDFCREVKERRPDTAIIFLTANDMESDMLKGYELGAEDYVTKPFPIRINEPPKKRLGCGRCWINPCKSAIVTRNWKSWRFVQQSSVFCDFTVS